MNINPQAAELNSTINSTHPQILQMLSESGLKAFFPSKGILGQSAQAKGREINATIGIALEESGKPMALKCIKDMVSLDLKDSFPYAPSFGRLDLREYWKNRIYRQNPSIKNKEFSLPVVTQALTHALSVSGLLFLNPGDTILTPDYYWGNYRLIFNQWFDTSMKTYPTFDENNYNICGLDEALGAGGESQFVLLNFPNNPTGYTLTEEEVESVISVIEKYAKQGKKLSVLVDDAYFGLVYEKGIYKESIFSKLCNLHENVLAIKVDGPTKEDYVWGFRVGFLSFGVKGGSQSLYSALEKKAAGAIRGNISNASHIGQSILLKAYQNPDLTNQKIEKYEILKKRYESIKSILESRQEFKSYFEALPFNSGYFMCVKLKEGLDAEKLRNHLLEKYSVGVIAQGNLIRIAFSSVPVNDVDVLLDRLYKACQDLDSN